MASTQVFPAGDLRNQLRQLGIALGENIHVVSYEQTMAAGECPRVTIELIYTGNHYTVPDELGPNPSRTQHALPQGTTRAISLTDEPQAELRTADEPRRPGERIGGRGMPWQ